MKFLKSILKSIIPKVILLKLKKVFHYIPHQTNQWSGNYPSWNDALDKSLGYQSDNILEKCRASLLKIKNKEAVYERDSLLFDKIQYSWPLLTALQNIVLTEKAPLSVVDFGGSLGSTFYQNKYFLDHIYGLQWHVVEQDNFVECGKKEFEDNRLKFHYSVDDIMLEEKPTCLLLSGVLQCLENPYQVIENFFKYNFPYIIIDRTAFIADKQQRLTRQTVPEYIYKASYPCWFFNEAQFLNKFYSQYNLIADFDSFADGPQQSEDKKLMYWKGYYFKRKD